jgi:hypothetical protein
MEAVYIDRLARRVQDAPELRFQGMRRRLDSAQVGYALHVGGSPQDGIERKASAIPAGILAQTLIRPMMQSRARQAITISRAAMAARSVAIRRPLEGPGANEVGSNGADASPPREA